MRLVFVIQVCIACAVLGKVEGVSNSCQNSPMDIIFVLDTSDAVDKASLESGKSLLKKLVESLFDRSNRFGLLTFGEHAFFQFQLNTYTSVIAIELAIDYMWLSTGKAQTEKAVEFSIDNGFVESMGDRLDIPNVLIVVALSEALNKTQMKSVSDKLQENMVDLILLDRRYTSIHDNENANIYSLTLPTPETLGNVTGSALNLICRAKGVLKPWTSWSACGSSCGTGTRRRFKECIKRQQNDACFGKTMESEKCVVKRCSDPVNGGWTYWQEWSVCSVTCGFGVQTRRRLCKAPVPENGGKFCQGLGLQTRNCSEWKCPNCSYICEVGSVLSAGCDICTCPNTTISGTIVTESNIPLENVDVYIETKPYEKLESTDKDGNFVAHNICLGNTTMIFRKQGYIELPAVAKVENDTYGNIAGKMQRIVPPVIIQQPENKVRMMGQNASLCCIAKGRPEPRSVQWFKNGDEISQTERMLKLTNISQDEAGIYGCSVETEAGIVKSQESVLSVFASAEESCSRPLLHTQQLPQDCYALQNATNLTVINVGKCSRESCIADTFKDNGTCTDTLNTFCCDVGKSEDVEIHCSGFSYTLKRVTSCACKECLTSSVVEGTAYGKLDNGSKIPFAYGNLYINGKRATVTNEMGYFQFEVSRDSRKAIVYFADDVFNKFVPTTKVINVQQDSSSYITAILPIKPPPVEFESRHGKSVILGGSVHLPPAGGLTIPENALVTEDGNTFSGKVKATVHFMDPRKISDLEASNGNFIYNTEDGTIAPLDTFGMLHTTFQDSNGRPLKLKTKVSFTLDASVFNVSLKDDGTPDLSLWSYDINNGIWIETAKMAFTDSGASNGRRKLLDQVLVGDFEIKEVDHIDLTVDQPVWERVIIGYTNCDHSVPVYGDRIVRRESKTNRNACFMSVSVYTDLTFRNKSGPGTNIVAVTKEMYGTKFIGMDSKTTDKNGHACLSVFCDSKVYVYAENKFDGTRLITSVTHDLPGWYENFNNTKNDTEVEIYSYNIEDVSEAGRTRYSPFVAYENVSKCSENFEKNYKFQFAYYDMPYVLTPTLAKDMFDEKLSWYPVSPRKPFAKACFIKVAVMTDDVSTQLIAESYQDMVSKNKLYGTYQVGPSFDVNSFNRSQKAACIEYRCAGRYTDNGTIRYNSRTIVNVNLISSKKCTVKIVSRVANMTIINGGKGFSFTADPNLNHGPKFGIYTGNGNADKIRNFCASGSDSGKVEKVMKPGKNVAVEFSCT